MEHSLDNSITVDPTYFFYAVPRGDDNNVMTRDHNKNDDGLIECRTPDKGALTATTAIITTTPEEEFWCFSNDDIAGIFNESLTMNQQQHGHLSPPHPLFASSGYCMPSPDISSLLFHRVLNDDKANETSNDIIDSNNDISRQMAERLPKCTHVRNHTFTKTFFKTPVLCGHCKATIWLVIMDISIDDWVILGPWQITDITVDTSSCSW